MLSGIAFQRGQLVFEDQLGVVKQAADQGRLAIVNGTAGQEAELVLAFLCQDIFGDGCLCSFLYVLDRHLRNILPASSSPSTHFHPCR